MATTSFSAVLVVCVMVSFVFCNLRSSPMKTVVCIPPCSMGQVICTFNDGGNGFNGSESCQRSCGPPVGNGKACKASGNHTCYWGWTSDAGWACFSGPPPCSPNNTVFDSAYMTCAAFKADYGGCNSTGTCNTCCSKTCHCRDLIEDKSECVCGMQD